MLSLPKSAGEGGDGQDGAEREEEGQQGCDSGHGDSSKGRDPRRDGVELTWVVPQARCEDGRGTDHQSLEE